MTIKMSKHLQIVLDYILEHENEDYFNWCEENGFDVDSEHAMNDHVYGAACKVLGIKPSSKLD